MVIFREDIPLLFDWMAADLSRLKRLPVIFNTPEKVYELWFTHEQTVVTRFHNRDVIHCPQACFNTSDALRTIELQYDWEHLVHEKEEETNKEKAG